MNEPSPDKEQKVITLYEEILSDIAKETGKPVYRVPKEHELNNLSAYTAKDNASKAFEDELSVVEYVPSECFSRYIDPNSPHSDKYRAYVFLPSSKSIIAVVLSKTDIPADSVYVGMESYLVDPSQPTRLKSELQATKHQRDFVTEEDYFKALPDRRKKLAENMDNKRDKDWEYFMDGKALTEKVDRVMNPQ